MANSGSWNLMPKLVSCLTVHSQYHPGHLYSHCLWILLVDVLLFIAVPLNSNWVYLETNLIGITQVCYPLKEKNILIYANISFRFFKNQTLYQIMITKLINTRSWNMIRIVEGTTVGRIQVIHQMLKHSYKLFSFICFSCNREDGGWWRSWLQQSLQTVRDKVGRIFGIMQ